MTDVVDLRGVWRAFGRVVALRDVTLAVPGGQFVAVMGATGSGKSTLLHCAAGLDRPTSGRVRLAGQDVTRMREAPLTRLRRDRVGFVFQAYNLLSELTVRQNVALPGRLGGPRPRRVESGPRPRTVESGPRPRTVESGPRPRSVESDPRTRTIESGPRTRTVEDVLAMVGLGGMGGRPVGELSGGQRQRVAIARALVTAPAVIFADEPTGALDPTTGGQVLALLREAVDRDAVTVVMVTHDPAAAAWSDRLVLLREGSVAADTPTPEAAEIAARLRAVTPVPAGSGHDAGAALAGRPPGGHGPGGAPGAFGAVVA